jgi:hypothetical protein
VDLRRIAPFALLSMLVSVVPVAADCAWVLWAGHSSARPFPELDTMLEAYESKPQCKAAIEQLVEVNRTLAAATPGRTVTRAGENTDKPGPHLIVCEPKGAGKNCSFESWQCLPSALDPRPPKAR